MSLTSVCVIHRFIYLVTLSYRWSSHLSLSDFRSIPCFCRLKKALYGLIKQARKSPFYVLSNLQENVSANEQRLSLKELLLAFEPEGSKVVREGSIKLVLSKQSSKAREAKKARSGFLFVRSTKEIVLSLLWTGFHKAPLGSKQLLLGSNSEINSTMKLFKQ